ncbi:hypothetical protein [Paenibacillus sp. DCT19]|uniref:hypothetical protein n=1 Tax=Paenibacillus sp. DCT19 TaxID=2211212 RepID=UPI000FE1C706|nr:hypothetical protein [Paenibacillus sp. DCT19]
MEDYNYLMQRFESWLEELLLRGLSQFSTRDLDVLQPLAEESLQLQMTFLHELVEHVIREGRRVALGEGDEDVLFYQFCRLTQYVQLSIKQDSV